MKSPIDFFCCGRHVLNQIETGITNEWIETNGLGSYASGTIVGANTRRYHALFIMTSPADLQRTVLVNRLEESILIRGKRVECACQEYPGTISPQGYLYIESFSLDPFPRWVYAIDDLKIEKTILMRTGEETALVVYRHLSGPSVKLILRPFISCRNHHSLIREDLRFKNAIEINGNKTKCTAPDSPPFYITAVGSNETVRIYPDGFWYKNLVYAQEEEKELDYQEDLYSPCQIHMELAFNQYAAVVFSDIEKQNIDPISWMEQEIKMRNSILEKFPIQGRLARQCAVLADQFIIRVNNETRILRGYPWSRGTIRSCLMSLPGICLATGRIEEARLILESCSKLLKRGLLPRRFSEPEPNYYGNMDASLWFVLAVQKYWETTKDEGFLQMMKSHILGIIESMQVGIKESNSHGQYEIKVDTDGLIWAYSDRYPLTWMDGKVGDWISTPRKGKPVEVQALWYNALQFCSEILLKLEGNDHGLAEQAKKARENFNILFWNSQNNYLYDVIDGNLREGSIRPNALYAVSLPYEILETEKFKPVVETAWRTLYTSFGLRTLAPQEPHYHGIYSGDERGRVSAAYNGTVFPFLVGPFLTAFFKAFGRDQKNKEQAFLFLRPFIAHLADAGVGAISELFDGDSPHNPRGTIADALAVGEILRVIKEEGLEI